MNISDTFNIVLNEKQKEAFKIFKTGTSFFLSGPAGVGKSYLIQKMKEWAEGNELNMQVTAMTGSASLLIGGKTLHSWAGIGLGEENPEILVQKIKKSFVSKMRWRRIEILVIDEISMMTPDLFEKLEYIAREIRNNSLYFGGIQIILSGDFYQLPPVVKDNGMYQDVNEKQNKRLFCFESSIWNKVITKTVQLDDIIRQSDPVFQKILNEIRIGKCSEESIEKLKSRMNLKCPKDLGIEPTKLFTRKLDVDMINDKKLKSLKNDIKTFTASTEVVYAEEDNSTLNVTSKEIEESHNSDLDPSIDEKVKAVKPVNKFKKNEIERLVKLLDKDASYEPELKLSIGAQVMLIINKDFKASLVNGSRGVIINFNPKNLPIVRFRNGLEKIIEPHTWIIQEKKGSIKRIQIPLKLAWGVTIHKIQGASLDMVEIDIGSNIFEYGQSYVGLSRVRTLDGLYIRDFNPKKIKAHPKVIEFYDNQSLQELNENFKISIDKPVGIKKFFGK